MPSTHGSTAKSEDDYMGMQDDNKITPATLHVSDCQELHDRDRNPLHLLMKAGVASEESRAVNEEVNVTTGTRP